MGDVAARYRHGGASEAALVEATQAGDADAAAEIVRSFWGDAYRVAYLMSHDPSASEEIAQDALLSAIRSIGSFEVGRPLRPWLQRIAANATLDWHRRRRRGPILVELDEAVDSGLADPDADEIAQSGVPDELLGALFQLDPEHRTAVVLRHVLDYQASEIAQLTGLPAATVRTRIRRGLQRMRRHLEAQKGTDQREQAG